VIGLPVAPSQTVTTSQPVVASTGSSAGSSAGADEQAGIRTARRMKPTVARMYVPRDPGRVLPPLTSYSRPDATARTGDAGNGRFC